MSLRAGAAAPALGGQQARTIYVRADGGDDLNDGGTPATALRTIGYGAFLARQGDRVVVGPGLYEEGVIELSDAFGLVSFIADSSGAEVGTAPGPVVVDATGYDTGFVLNHNLATTIDGFVIFGAAHGIYVKSESHQSRVLNNVVTDNRQNGIYVQDSNQVLVFNNLVYGNRRVGILVTGDVEGSQRATVMNNTVYANDDRGIHISGTDVGSPGALVLNNAVEGNLGNDHTGIQVNRISLPGYVSAGNVNVDRFKETPIDATDRRVATLLAVDPDGPDGILGGLGFADDDFRFAQVAAGQAEDSAAVNAGVVPADAVGLSGASTRTDGAPDDGGVDAGYHYGNLGAVRIPELAELRYVPVYVNAATGSDGNTGAAPETPLRTLAAALGVARAGHRIVLAAGTYREGDLIPEVSGPGGRDLAIGGAEGTVINATAHRRGLQIRGGGWISLSDLAITGARIAAVQVRKTSRADLTRVALSANTGHGLWVQEESVVSVSASRLDQNRNGIRTENSEVTVTDCSVCASCQEGIRARGGTLRVAESLIELGGNDGLAVSEAAELTLTATMVGANDVGVQVNDAASVSVTESVLYSNRGPGVRLIDVPTPQLWNNLIYANGYGSEPNDRSSGAVIRGDDEGSPDAEVLNNTFYQNADRGLVIGGDDFEPASPRSTVKRNLFEGNADGGLQINRLSLSGYTGDYNLHADRPGITVGEHDVIAAAGLVDADGPDGVLGGAGVADDDFRLQQLAAGQSTQSPAVDAGGIDAVDAYLEHRTTRTDNGADSGVVDIGFHYREAPFAHCDLRLAERSCQPITETADCNGDGRISIDEVILGVNMALSQQSLDECPSFDRNADDQINVDELVGAIVSMLETA